MQKIFKSLLLVLSNNKKFAEVQPTMSKGQIDPLLICMAHKLKVLFMFVNIGKKGKESNIL